MTDKQREVGKVLKGLCMCEPKWASLAPQVAIGTVYFVLIKGGLGEQERNSKWLEVSSNCKILLMLTTSFSNPRFLSKWCDCAHG